MNLRSNEAYGKPYKAVYCEDPFGNIIEIYTHSYEQIWSSK
jgi:catechol-2,3-dioxygenase